MIDLFDAWHKKGLVEPHFIIRKPLSNMVPELKKRNWKYYPLYYTNWSQRKPSRRAEDIFRNAKYNAEAVGKIEKIIAKVKPDIVMTNTIVSPWAALAAYFQRVPHAWFVREYGDIDHQHVFELGREKMLEDIDTLSDLVITNSKTLADHIGQYMKRGAQPLYTPFDLKKLESKSQEPSTNPFKYKDSLKLVITGRVAPSKGQDEAARAVGELIKKGFNAELCVIGLPAATEDADALHEVIDEYGISDNVHILGQQGNPLAIVKYADIGIMASQQEAFGRVTFEYMATGRPVIGANSGATPELIEDGVNGYLYKKGDLDSLIKQLLKYAKQKKLIDKHGTAAKRKAEAMMKGDYSADKLYEVIEELLQSKVLDDKKPLNFSRRWIDYPLVAQQYIEDSKVITFKSLFKMRVRTKLKSIYLKITGLFEKENDN
jgi:glycosyltransferase involved in cell wall biosynthesis